MDVAAALVAYLKADSGVAAIVSARVFAGELPRDETTNMPRVAVVLSPAGGGIFGRSYQDFGDSRIDVDCYGRTPREAWTLYLAVHAALKHLQHAVTGGVLVHWAVASSKGTTARDPDTDWPLTMSSWQVLASEVEAA